MLISRHFNVREKSVIKINIVTMSFLGVSLISACSWVRPEVSSHYVSLVKPQLVQSCKKLGLTTSKSVSKIIIVPRSEAKIMNELIILAKNQAVIMKGDTIAAEGPFSEGRQTFGIYRCSEGVGGTE